jgi:hypothetical protein
MSVVAVGTSAENLKPIKAPPTSSRETRGARVEASVSLNVRMVPMAEKRPRPANYHNTSIWGVENVKAACGLSKTVPTTRWKARVLIGSLSCDA